MKGMTKNAALFAALFAVMAGFAFAQEQEREQEMYFNGWTVWPERAIRAAVSRNSVTFTGNVPGMAGYVNARLNPAMRNRVVRLEIRNADQSTFYDARMFKITVNQNDITVNPTNIMNLIEEYIPEYETVVVFPLPDDFDGKLGFVFYQADLKGLQITATYK